MLIRFERSSAASTTVSRAVVSATFRFTAGQAETITAAHIHPGIEGANGGVLLPLNPASRFDVAANAEGVIQTQFEVADQNGIHNLLNIAGSPGDFYANVHSVAKGGGLLRGQLRNAASADAACLRSAVGSLGQQVEELGRQVSTIAAAASTVGTAVGTIQADIAALRAAAGAIQADLNAIKANTNLGGLSDSVKTILRLVVLSAARDGVIGAGERDQLLATIK